MQPRTEFLATSVASNLLTRFSRTHERRRITVVAGNPGIGKTEAIKRFHALNPGQVAMIELGEGPKGGHSSTAALNFAIAALEAVTNSYEVMGAKRSTNHLELRNRFWDLAARWGGFSPRHARHDDFDQNDTPLCTIVFDEAQHLSMGGIEALRSINDAARGGFSPFRIGLIFVGNHEFALRATPRKPSVLTEAVSDRLLYSISLDHEHVTDDDLTLYLENRTSFETGALDLALKFFAARPAHRTFRQAENLLERLRAEVGDARITTATVRHVLAVA